VVCVCGVCVCVCVMNHRTNIFIVPDLGSCVLNCKRKHKCLCDVAIDNKRIL